MNRPQTDTTRITQERLDDIVRRLVEALSPRRIIYFGSHAYGEPHADSDLDILVLVRDSELERDDHDERGYRSVRGMFLPIELHTQTPWEGIEPPCCFQPIVFKTKEPPLLNQRQICL